MKYNIESFKERVLRENLSLRDAEQLCGVSASTLSRWMRGGEITYKNFEKIDRFLSGEFLPKPIPKCTKKFVVGKKTFLITVSEI